MCRTFAAGHDGWDPMGGGYGVCNECISIYVYVILMNILFDMRLTCCDNHVSLLAYGSERALVR